MGGKVFLFYYSVSYGMVGFGVGSQCIALHCIGLHVPRVACRQAGAEKAKIDKSYRRCVDTYIM
jgi:hypothetical protein